MSVRVVEPRGQARLRAGADARRQLVSVIREVARRAAERKEGGGAFRLVSELNAYVEAEPGRGLVILMGEVVDEVTGRLVVRDVARAHVRVKQDECEARLSAAEASVSRHPPQSLALLPDAFNALLSEFKVGRLLGRLGFAGLRARGVSARRMLNADDLKPKPVVLVGLDVGGRTFTLNAAFHDFHIHLERRNDKGAWEARLEYDILVRHGDRKLAKRLYVLAWLRRELRRALERLKEEKGYQYTVLYYTFEVNLGDKEVELTFPFPGVSYLDEEYAVIGKILYLSEDEVPSLAEVMARGVVKMLEEIKEESSRRLTMFVEDAKRLMDSKDPRLKELGLLLALLVIKAYEEVERVIPG
jgi:hypothetical protein